MTPLIKKLSEPKYILSIGVLYTLLITVAFLTPISEIPRVDFPISDKLIHLLTHWGLIFIWLWYLFLSDKNHISIKIVFVVLFIYLLYGIIIEALQHWLTTTRTFDLFDIIANGIGSIIGLLSFWIVKNRTFYESV